MSRAVDAEEATPARVAVIGALGVVYGDIGTSPLYAFQQSLDAAGSHDAGAVLGVVSLIFWSLALSVTLKYVIVMMRADNEGEGGILALYALVQRSFRQFGVWPKVAVMLAMAGTALFFCDALITPAITVLSAVEGLKLVDPGFSGAIIPLTVIILIVLYAIQKRGTARVGGAFGPIMAVWFIALGVSGAAAIAAKPEVLAAVDPVYGIALLAHRPGVSLAIIGAVFLAITGGEALYADMGHFGKRPVRVAWFGLVWPALLLNYFGQGALLLSAGGAVSRPMYALFGPTLLPVMLALATAASVIASQAVISGTFSVARQAVQLDMLPRMRILQTSAVEQGQIYVPVVNLLQFVAVVGFVLGFRSSDALGGAYGAAVVGTMFITTLLGSFVASTQWGWGKWRAGALFSVLFVMDLVFVIGNMTKVADGGWVPLTLAAIVFTVFTIWRNGRLDLRHALGQLAVPLVKLPDLVSGVQRVAGTGVFLASHPGFVPSALLRNIEHNRVVHERSLILTFEVMRTPRVNRADRVRIKELMAGVYLVTAFFGFMETPDMRETLRACRSRDLRVYLEDCSFYIGQHVVVARPRPGWGGLKRRIFARMQRRSASSAEFFRMPVRDVMILNTVVEI